MSPGIVVYVKKKAVKTKENKTSLKFRAIVTRVIEGPVDIARKMIRRKRIKKLINK